MAPNGPQEAARLQQSRPRPDDGAGTDYGWRIARAGEATFPTPPDAETVDHPAHYNQHPAGIECIDVVEAFNFNLGNAIKYIWRAGLKPGTTTLEDLSKAAWYIRREIERIEKEQALLRERVARFANEHTARERA